MPNAATSGRLACLGADREFPPGADEVTGVAVGNALQVILMFGLGMAPKVVIAAVICFFPTLVNMIRGLESITPNEHELFRILSASKAETLWRLRLPRAAPFLFSSLRIASATAVIGAVVGEWIGSDRGLGAMIIQATFNYQSGRLYAAIVLCSLLSISIFALVVACEKWVIRYHD